MSGEDHDRLVGELGPDLTHAGREGADESVDVVQSPVPLEELVVEGRPTHPELGGVAPVLDQHVRLFLGGEGLDQRAGVDGGVVGKVVA